MCRHIYDWNIVNCDVKQPIYLTLLWQNYWKLDNAKRGIPSQGGKVDLDLWPRDPKSIGFLLSSWWMCMWSMKVIGQKLKSLLCPQGLIHRVPKWPWPLTSWPKINRVPPLIIHNLHMKFESDWAKTVVCIVSTRSYTQSAKVDLDLWPRDPKSIGFLLSSWWMCMWSLKMIGQKL